MTRIRMTGWIAASALLAAVLASAETFHSQDGVVFEGTMRKVVPQAAVCNVLEEKYTSDEYERLKENQGQPLDLWQVDYTVRNESGWALEHLRASSWVRSEHPPCTNWSGEGPGGGPLLPEPSLPISIFWTDNYEVLQMPYGMRLGQQVRRSFYLEVFHEHQPRFGEWDIDYRFAAGSEAAGESGGTAQSGRGLRAPSPAASFELPPEIEADRYLLQAEQAVREGDAAAARTAMERLEALQQDHGLESAPEDHYRYAQTWAAAGEPERATAAVVRYLRIEGREAEYYTEALELLNRTESGKLAPAGDETRAQPPEPSCSGQESSGYCWTELESHPGCYVFALFDPGSTWTWSAGCAEGMASGSGTMKLSHESYGVAELTGRVQNGKLTGHWVIREAKTGAVNEGPFVDGKKNGHWVIRDGDGHVAEGPFVDGKMNGRWVQRLADGDVGEGPYVNGKRDGRWVWLKPSGRTETVTYVNGERQ